MAKKTVKKVNVKKVTKLEVNELVKVVKDMFNDLDLGEGISTENGIDYGFTEGSLVFKGAECDVQIKIITPKAGVDRYEKATEE